MFDLADHPFSPESIAREGGAASKSERAWSRFYDECERLLGHCLDGDDVGGDGDGYSIDEASDRFAAGSTAAAYVSEVKSRERYRPY